MNHTLKVVAATALILFSVFGGILITERTNLAEGLLAGLLILAIGSAIFICYGKVKDFLDLIIEERALKEIREAH
jgi:Na+/proline symporter